MSPTSRSMKCELPKTFVLANGESCTLRTLVEDDAEECCALLPRFHVETDFLNWVPGEFKLTIEQEREFIRSRMDVARGFTVGAEIDGALVGLAGAWSPEFKKFQHHAELGVSILKDYWDLGIGTRMMQSILDWGVQRELHKIYLRVFAHNERAYRWYVSLGFVEEGRLKDDVIRADGTFGDVIVMARYYNS